MTAYEFYRTLPDEFARELSLIPLWAKAYAHRSPLRTDDLSIWAIDFSRLAQEPKVAIALMSERGLNDATHVIVNDIEVFLGSACPHIYEYRGVASGSWRDFAFTMFRDKPIEPKNSVSVLATEPSVCLWKGENTSEYPVIVRLIPECYKVYGSGEWKKVSWFPFFDNSQTRNPEIENAWTEDWKKLSKMPMILRFPNRPLADIWKKKVIDNEWEDFISRQHLKVENRPNMTVLPAFITRNLSESGIIPNETDFPCAIYKHMNKTFIAYQKEI